MQPKQEYGYVIIDTEEKRKVFSPKVKTDQIWREAWAGNLTPDDKFWDNETYRRRISPGEGFEIVPLSEAMKFNWDKQEVGYTSDGIKWLQTNSPAYWYIESGGVLAYRRPIKQTLPAPIEQCPVAKRVADRIINRAETGMKKYGVNLERGDLTTGEWLQHLQDELLDAAAYVERLKAEDLKPVQPPKPMTEGEALNGLFRNMTTVQANLIEHGWNGYKAFIEQKGAQ